MQLTAFWSYDTFPYLLHAEVLKEQNNGFVAVQGYGGMKVKPKHLLIGDHGKKVSKSLNNITAAYYAELRALKQKYEKQVDCLFE